MAKQKRKPKPKAKPAKRTKPKTSKAKAKAKPKPAKAKAKPKAKPKPKPKAKPRQRAATLPEDGVPQPEVLADGSGGAGTPGTLKDQILAMARRLYGANKTDAELLAFDPNDVDAMDPSIFYEMLQERYGVQADPTNDYFGGFGGTLEHLIAFVTERWDGVTNKATEEPPSDWLGDFVHDAD